MVPFRFFAQFSRVFGRREAFSQHQEIYRRHRFRVRRKREYWGDGDLWELDGEEIARTAIYTKRHISYVKKVGLIATAVAAGAIWWWMSS
jgi:hypothetical protein